MRGPEKRPDSQVLFQHGDVNEPDGASYMYLKEQHKDLVPDPQSLWKLAQTMHDEIAPRGKEQNTPIPAGYTYLGQFIVHDVTFMTERAGVKPLNKRTPGLDLDSVYSPRPLPGRVQPEVATAEHPRFLEDGKFDLPRDGQGVARIPDPRNDENVIIAQIHVLFMKFHDRVVELLGNRALSSQETFQLAQKIVRWHYQWIVVDDYLRRLVSEDALTRRCYHATAANCNEFCTDLRLNGLGKAMPFEFVVAAFRFGHSMVRIEYKLNSQLDTRRLLRKRGSSALDLSGGQPIQDRGLRIEWRRFFETGQQDDPDLQFARPIDAYLSIGLEDLPDSATLNNDFRIPSPARDDDAPHIEPGKGLDADRTLTSLAFRNLLRGRKNQLASGQDVADLIGLPRLPAGELFPGSSPEQSELRQLFGDHTPLWYYILREANCRMEGKKLGPIGGIMLSQVLRHCLRNTGESYATELPDWTPEWSKTKGRFDMADLIRIVEHGWSGITAEQIEPTVERIATAGGGRAGAG